MYFVNISIKESINSASNLLANSVNVACGVVMLMKLFFFLMAIWVGGGFGVTAQSGVLFRIYAAMIYQ